MELKDWLNSINMTKKNLMDEDPDLESGILHALSIGVFLDF